MRKIFITLSFNLFLIFPLLGQNQMANLEKYWKYRQELRDKFIVISGNVEEPGVNIPAADIHYYGKKPYVGWGDGNSNMSHYLSMLATELWLLKNNNQDYSTTLKELYYAMLAMERLDLYSEQNFRKQENKGNSVNPSTDINGFHSRDDVSQAFWDKYSSHFPVGDFVSCYKREYSDKIYDISQDNIYHNMEGLALVARLVGTENVGSIPVTFQTNHIPNYLTSKGIKNGNTVNFSLWAKDFIKRYIKVLQNSKVRFIMGVPTHWYLENPVTGNLVEDGSGKDLDMATFYGRGAIHVGNAIVGENLGTYDGIGGEDYSKKIFKDLFEQHAVDLSDIRVLTLEVAVAGALALPTAGLSIVTLPAYILIHGKWQKVDKIITDYYKIHSLACVGNVSGASTFTSLYNYLLSYNPKKVCYPGTGTRHFPIYEHFPLMYLALHDPNCEIMNMNNSLYNPSQLLYEHLLNIAPFNGCWDNGRFEWSSTSRCVWPESLTQNNGQNIQYSGLDYMMLHNLFYIAFHKQDLKTLFIDQNSPANLRKENVSYGTIVTSASILADNVTYAANNGIAMRPGFSTAGKTNFSAKIQPRSGYYNGSLYKIIPFNNGGSGLKSDTPPVDLEDLEELRAILLDLLPPADDEQYELPLELEVIANEETNIAIFPNPTDGVFRIQANGGIINAVEIKNVQGITVFKEENLSENETVVDFSTQPPGAYLVTVMQGKNARTVKIVKY